MNRNLFTCLPLLLLAACGTGPSESDMNAAIEQSMRDTHKQLENISGKAIADRFKEPTPNLKKIGCKEDGDKAYICDVEATVNDRTTVVPLRFVKASDGWRIGGIAQR